METDQIDHTMDLEGSLSRILIEVGQSRSFAFGQSNASLPNPGLVVNGHGPVGMPLSPNDATALINQCQKSAFGKGTETCVDENVRRSWELNADQFELRNPAWAPAIAALLPIVCERLRLPPRSQGLRADLYKLLLYEDGAFFRAHQDSEKTPGMLGTLVVALPSWHQGGTLAFRHQNDTYTFDTSPCSEFGFSWGAWYEGPGW
jgi:hypothetical protein